MIECGIAEPPGTGRFAVSDGRWTFAGALTLGDAAAVLDAAAALPLPAGGVVDFGGLTRADSSALAVIIALRRRAAAEGRPLAIEGLPASLHSLALAYGVEDLIH